MPLSMNDNQHVQYSTVIRANELLYTTLKQRITVISPSLTTFVQNDLPCNRSLQWVFLKQRKCIFPYLHINMVTTADINSTVVMFDFVTLNP